MEFCEKLVRWGKHSVYMYEETKDRGRNGITGVDSLETETCKTRIE